MAAGRILKDAKVLSAPCRPVSVVSAPCIPLSRVWIRGAGVGMPRMELPGRSKGGRKEKVYVCGEGGHGGWHEKQNADAGDEAARKEVKRPKRGIMLQVARADMRVFCLTG